MVVVDKVEAPFLKVNEGFNHFGFVSFKHFIHCFGFSHSKVFKSIEFENFLGLYPPLKCGQLCFVVFANVLLSETLL